MSKVSRIHSLESGPFTSSNNLIHLKIPQGSTYDMSESYVEVQMSATDDSTSSATFDLEVKYNGFDLPVFNEALVSRSRVHGSRVGQLEEINRVDLLQSSLKNYELSRDDKESLEYSSLYQLYGPYGQKHSVFRNLVSQGQTLSTNERPRFRIPLSKLSGVGELVNLDTKMTGDLTYTLELNTDKITAEAIGDVYELVNDVTTATDTIVLANKSPFSDCSLFVGQVISISSDSWSNQLKTITAIAYGVDGTVTVTLASALPAPGTGGGSHAYLMGGVLGDDVPESTAATNTIKLKDAYDNLESVPFWNNQNIRINATANGGTLADITEFRKVLQVIFDSSSGEVSLVFDGAALFATGSGETYTSVIVNSDTRNAYTAGSPDAHPPTNISLSFEQVDMVMVMANPELGTPDEYQFSTYVLEQFSGAGVQNYNQSVTLDPMCDGALITFSPQSNEPPYSLNDVITNYRLRLNNVNMSQRNVVVNKPLYYDDVLKFMTNDGRELKSLLEIPSSKIRDLVVAQQHGRNNVVIPLTAPLTVNNKLLNVNVNCSASGVQTMNVFKSVQKTL